MVVLSFATTPTEGAGRHHCCMMNILAEHRMLDFKALALVRGTLSKSFTYKLTPFPAYGSLRDGADIERCRHEEQLWWGTLTMFADWAARHELNFIVGSSSHMSPHTTHLHPSPCLHCPLFLRFRPLGIHPPPHTHLPRRHAPLIQPTPPTTPTSPKFNQHHGDEIAQTRAAAILSAATPCPTPTTTSKGQRAIDERLRQEVNQVHSFSPIDSWAYFPSIIGCLRTTHSRTSYHGPQWRLLRREGDLSHHHFFLTSPSLWSTSSISLPLTAAR